MNRFDIEQKLKEIDESNLEEQDAIKKSEELICEYLKNKYKFKLQTYKLICNDAFFESMDYDLFSYSYLFMKCLNTADFVKDILRSESED